MVKFNIRSVRKLVPGGGGTALTQKDLDEADARRDNEEIDMDMRVEEFKPERILWTPLSYPRASPDLEAVQAPKEGDPSSPTNPSPPSSTPTPPPSSPSPPTP